MNSYDTRLSQVVKHLAAARIASLTDTMSMGMMDERAYRYAAGQIAGMREISTLFDEAVKQIEGNEEKK